MSATPVDARALWADLLAVREHAPLVMDCNGLAEGGYQKETGVNINARARNNYSSWCNPKGTGKIPAAHRVPGAAVFIHNGSYVSHVGFLWKPVVSGKPEGDWWVIEARGVLYGVVATKLNARGWNRWGLMTKYFDYSDAGLSDTPIYEFGHRELSYGDTGSFYIGRKIYFASGFYIFDIHIPTVIPWESRAYSAY